MFNLKEFVDDQINDFINEIDVQSLKDIELKTNAPQVSRSKYKTEVKDEKIFVLDNNFKPNHTYDYVVDSLGEIYIGDGHYKLASKAGSVKAAGEIVIDQNGKVTYLNNESGHYEPSKEDLDVIANKFKELNLTSTDFRIEKRY